MSEEFIVNKKLQNLLSPFEIEVAKEFYRVLESEIKDVNLRNIYLPVLQKAVENTDHNEEIMEQTVNCIKDDYEEHYNNPYWLSDIKNNIRYTFL